MVPWLDLRWAGKLGYEGPVGSGIMSIEAYREGPTDRCNRYESVAIKS